MEVVKLKVRLKDWEFLEEELGPFSEYLIVLEQYTETEEILEKERELEITKQTVKDLYKELKELKHPKK